MEELITLENLIKEAVKNGVDFGKGDPYNRLRYYTKIGLLPHMIRKSVNGELIAHYPADALDTLIEIEKLKSLGYKNEDIGKKIKALKGTNPNEGPKITALKVARALTPSAKTIRLGLFVAFCLTVMAGLDLIPLGKSRNDLIQKTLELDKRSIIDSGTAYVPRNQNRAYVKSQSVKQDSKINVTFNSDYSPATRYWVSQRNTFEGFYVELDSPTASDAEFNWWISN